MRNVLKALIRRPAVLLLALTIGGGSAFFAGFRFGDTHHSPSDAFVDCSGPECASQQTKIHDFVVHYFKAWSDRDMEAYERCFFPGASVQYLNPKETLDTIPLKSFLEGQRAFLKGSPPRTMEFAEKIDIRFEGELARAVVYWVFRSGEKIEHGYDHFTLRRMDGEWRILNLLFYEAK